MATFSGQPNRNDVFVGTNESDIFNFASADLDGGDTVSGGNGPGVDELRFTTPGNINTTTLAGVTGMERLVLANGTNTLVLSNARLSLNGWYLEVAGGYGDDRIDLTKVTDSRYGAGLTAGKGFDTLLGGAGNDVFRFAVADLDGNDVVTGGAGTDKLTFTDAGVITAGALANVTGIEKIQLANGTNSIALTNTRLGLNGGHLEIIGGSGADTIDLSAVTSSTLWGDIIAGTGNDVLRGGAGADVFRFAASALNANDTVSGGGGADTLAVTTAGTLTMSVLANVTGIETVALADGVNDFSVGNSWFSANGPRLNLIGGSGDDRIDISAVTDSRFYLVATPGMGRDIVMGGAANDEIRFEVAALDGGDTVDGGGGYDTLAFTTAGAITTTTLANVTNIETIRLAEGLNNLTLSNTRLGANGGYLNLFGAGGNDTIDLSGVSNVRYWATITPGAGDDVLRGGAGDDVFRFAAADFNASDIVAAGAGSDTLVLTTAGIVDLAGLAQVERVRLAGDGVNTMVITDAHLAANGWYLEIEGGTGRDLIDLSGVTNRRYSVGVTASAGNDVLRGGAGDDVFRFATADLDASDIVTGGGGTDKLRFTTAGTITKNMLANVTGIEKIQLADGANFLTITTARLSENGELLSIAGGSGADAVDASTSAAGQGVIVSAAGGADTLLGGAGADVLDGGDDNDIIKGGKGADWLDGGSGDDAITMDIESAQVSGGDGTDVLYMPYNPFITFDATNLHDQTLGDSAIVTGFESMNFTYGDSGIAPVFGDASNNTYAVDNTGGRVLDGKEGYDTLLLGYPQALPVDMSGIFNFEEIRTINNIHRLDLTDRIMAYNSPILTIRGNNEAVGEVNAGALSADYSVHVYLTGGQYRGPGEQIGGAGDDVYEYQYYNVFPYSYSVTVDGGYGADTIFLDNYSSAGREYPTRSGGTGISYVWLNLTGIEAVVLSGTTLIEAVADSLVATATNATVLFDGSNSISNINASQVKSGHSVHLVGGAGTDIFSGGAGDDVLTGGEGADQFGFRAPIGSGNIDTITDFSVLDDTIQLDDAIFSAAGALGTLGAGAFWTGSAAHDADDRIVYNATTGALFYDADGDGAGAAVQFATIGTGLALTNADFVLI